MGGVEEEGEWWEQSNKIRTHSLWLHPVILHLCAYLKNNFVLVTEGEKWKGTGEWGQREKKEMSHYVVPKINWFCVLPLRTVGADLAVTVLFRVPLGEHVLHRVAVFPSALCLMAVTCIRKLGDTKYFSDFLAHDLTWKSLAEDIMSHSSSTVHLCFSAT